MTRMRKKALFIFVLSFLVYLFYFSGTNPGYYSRDVVESLKGLLNTDNLFNGSLPNFYDESFFYKIYILVFYLVTKNLVALGLFQIVLASAINTYCWIILTKFSKAKVAWLVTLLMIFSPVNGFMTIWYHRSSLFACLVCLNLILLYKFSKVQRFERLERSTFLINLLLISFLRLDGIIVSLGSLFIYILKSKHRKQIKIGIFVGFILMLSIYNLAPKGCNYRNRGFFLIFPFTSQVQRIHQSTGSEFTDKDLKVLNKIVDSDLDIKLWLEEKGWLDYSIFNEKIAQKESSDFIRWSSLFILRNLPHFIKTQAQVFFDSSLLGSPLAYYFHNNDLHRNEDYFIEVKKRVPNISNNPYIEFPDKIGRFILKYRHYNFLGNPRAFFVALIFGTSIPFVLIFAYFVIALKRNRNVLIPLVPLLLYGIFMFLFQPKAKAYYWYWLAYSYYFIVFGLGYEIISAKKSISLKGEGR